MFCILLMLTSQAIDYIKGNFSVDVNITSVVCSLMQFLIASVSYSLMLCNCALWSNACTERFILCAILWVPAKPLCFVRRCLSSNHNTLAQKEGQRLEH